MAGARDPVQALLETIRAYLRRRGDIVIPTARAAGQARLKIAFRGLYRSLPEGLEYARFEDIVAEIESDRRLLDRVESMGIRFVVVGGEKYVEAPLDLLDRLAGGESRG